MILERYLHDLQDLDQQIQASSGLPKWFKSNAKPGMMEGCLGKLQTSLCQALKPSNMIQAARTTCQGLPMWLKRRKRHLRGCQECREMFDWPFANLGLIFHARTGGSDEVCKRCQLYFRWVWDLLQLQKMDIHRSYHVSYGPRQSTETESTDAFLMEKLQLSSNIQHSEEQTIPYATWKIFVIPMWTTHSEVVQIHYIDLWRCDVYICIYCKNICILMYPYVSIYPSIHLSIHLSISPSLHLSIYRSIYLSILIHVWGCVTYEYKLYVYIYIYVCIP